MQVKFVLVIQSERGGRWVKETFKKHDIICRQPLRGEGWGLRPVFLPKFSAPPWIETFLMILFAEAIQILNKV